MGAVVETQKRSASRGHKARILVVPGFVADTYSEIERSYVELCANPNPELEFLWLVPDMSSRYLSFANSEGRFTMREPAYVPHLREYGIPYVVGNISKYNFISNFVLFWRIISRYQIDAVYTHFGYERFWGMVLAKVWRKRAIWNEHWYSLGMRHRWFKRFFYRIFVDDFISVSEFLARTLPQNKRVHTVLNAIQTVSNAPRTVEALSDLRKSLGISEESIVVLMVAAFTSQKRHSIALKVCKEVIQACGNVVFVFLGNGETRAQFLADVTEHGLGHRILAPGYVKNVEQYYAIADACMLTSSCEGFGYTVLEAMTHSLPVVVFESGALPELVKDGETGFLVVDGEVSEFAQKLLELIHEKDLRAKMGKNARQVVQRQHSRDSWFQHLNATLLDIVTAHRVGPGRRKPIRS